MHDEASQAYSLLPGPHGERLPDDGRCGNDPEITAVRRVRRLPVHDKDFVGGKNTAPLSDGQPAAAAVALARLPHFDVVDNNREFDSANGLPWQRQNALEQGQPKRQITVQVEETRERLGRPNGDEISDGEPLHRLQTIETNRNAL